MKLTEIADSEPKDDTDLELTPAYKDTYDIPANVFPALEQRIAKLNRKARRLKVPVINLTIEKEFFDKHNDPENPEGPRIEEKYYTVKVEGEAPQIRGYKFMATIEHKEGGNIIRTVPGEENNPEIRNFYEAHPDYCDHCHKVRRRNDTFIIRNLETGELRQIGRNCLADFLGGMDPKQILWYFSLKDLVNRAIGEAREGGRYGRAELAVDPATVLNIAAALIQKYGYARRADEEMGRWPTSSMVRFAIFERLSRNPSEQQIEIKDIVGEISKNGPSEKVQQQVKDAVDWFKSIPEQEKEASEFYHNIDVLLNSSRVSPRDIGYLAAIFPAYYRAQGLKKERESKSNEWVGTVGDKLPPTKVTCVSVQRVQTDYGTTAITRMEDEKGNSIVWFNSGHNFGLDQGETATIVGTVKKHDEYKGRKQTVVIRVRPPKETTTKKSEPPLTDQWGNVIGRGGKKVLDKTGNPIKQTTPQQPQTSQQPANIPTTTGAGSKIAQAISKFQEFQQQNGRIPSMSEFKQILTAPPFNMSNSAASTYYYTAKKRAGVNQ